MTNLQKSQRGMHMKTKWKNYKEMEDNHLALTLDLAHARKIINQYRKWFEEQGRTELVFTIENM